MIINDLDGYYIVFDTKNWNTELDTLVIKPMHSLTEIEICQKLGIDTIDVLPTIN